jgi:hypothetical protein
VANLYLGLLHRPPDPAGLDAAVRFLEAGGQVSLLQTFLAGSPEYLQTRGGGMAAGFVAALYQDATGLTPDVQTQAAALAQLGGGMTREQLALGVWTGAAAADVQAQALYDGLVDHPADAGALSTAFGTAPAGTRDQLFGEVVSAIFGSPEYLDLSA